MTVVSVTHDSLGETMCEFRITVPEQIEGALRLRDYMSSRVPEARLVSYRLPDGYGFILDGSGTQYCVVMGSRVFHVLRNRDVLAIVLRREYVRLRLDFTTSDIGVTVFDLRDDTSQKTNQERRARPPAHV